MTASRERTSAIAICKSGHSYPTVAYTIPSYLLDLQATVAVRCTNIYNTVICSPNDEAGLTRSRELSKRYVVMLNSNMSRLAASALQTRKEITRRAQTCKERLVEPEAVMPRSRKGDMDAVIQRNATRLTR
jgi:hypothetical protein